MPRPHWIAKIVRVALLLLFLGLLATFVVPVNFWHSKIAAALSQELGRPVRTGAIHLKLLGGLGFEISDVVVEEDPRFGIEPFARMETLRATLGLDSLWRNRMRFSSLVIVRPSLNLVRNADGRWNLASLWAAPKPADQRNTRTSRESFQPLPRITMESGRINFKVGNYKKAYAVDSLDMEMNPPSSPSGPWRVSFEGRGNRTDFPLNAVNRFRGQAEFVPFSPGIRSEAGTLAHLDLAAENAMVGELLRLFTGNDYGVHGSLNLHLHLAGTQSLLRLSGSADLRDLHRWDLLPPPAASSLHAEIAAILDLEKESLELRSVSVPLTEGSLVVQGEITQPFDHPQPDLRAELRGVSLATVLEIAKQFTPRLDPRFMAQGSVDGRLQMKGSRDALSGTLNVTRGLLQVKGTPQSARLSDFGVTMDGTTGRAGPVKVHLGEGESLDTSLEWNFSKRELVMNLESDAVPLNTFLPWASVLGSRWGQASFSKGNLALGLKVAAVEGKASEINGWAQISDALLHSEAVNQPIQIPGARLQFQPGKVRVKPFSAELGLVEFQGGFVAKLPPPASQVLAPGHPFPTIEFDLQASKIDIADLDQVLNPSHRPAPFFRFPGSAGRGSAFFAGLLAQGTLQAGLVSYRGSAIKNFKGSMDFRDRTLEIKSFSGEFAGGTQDGKATVQFGPGPPAFSLQSRFSSVDLNSLTKASPAWSGFFSGKLSGLLRLAGSGRDLREIVDHLGGSGEATGLNLEINGLDLARSPESKADSGTRIASLTSAFQIAKKEILIKDLKIVPALRPLSGEQKAPVLAVTGAVGFDRTLDLLVTEKDGGRPTHWRGTLAAPLVGETAASLHPTLRSTTRPASRPALE